MLQELSYYFVVAKKEKEEWEKLEDKYSFIKECYLLAQKVPVSDFWKQYLNLKSATELEMVRDKVTVSMTELDSSSLNRALKMYTPIKHIKEQLEELHKKIIGDLRDYDLWLEEQRKVVE